MLERQEIFFAVLRAEFSAGRRRVIKIAIIVIIMRSSIRVNLSDLQLKMDLMCFLFEFMAVFIPFFLFEVFGQGEKQFSLLV